MDSGCRGIAVRGCTSTDNGGSGFASGQSELGVPGHDGTVRDSLFARNRRRGIVIVATEPYASSGYRVIGNQVHDNSSAGIELMGMHSPLTETQVLDNVIRDNGHEGITMTGPSGSTRVMIRHNDVEGNGRIGHDPGLHLATNLNDIDIEHNTFADRKASPTQGPAILFAAGITVDGATIRANNYRHNPAGGVLPEDKAVDSPARP
jgi:hypothetical protein